MLDPEEDESTEMCDLNDGDRIDRPQASCHRKLCGEKSVALKLKNTEMSSFKSSITASLSDDWAERNPWTFCTVLAGLIFWLLSISIWIFPKYVRWASLFWRWAKDLFICILIHPMTGLNFTVSYRKHGLHLALVNILTAGSVVCWVMLLLTSMEKLYKEKSYIIESTHILRYLTLNIQAFLLYPIWAYHLKHKHTAAEKTVGFIVFVSFCSDILGSMAAKLTGGPDLNTTFVISLKENDLLPEGQKDEHAGRIFLGAVFQAAIMTRWNLLWIFCDIMLESDFHRHTRTSNLVLRESGGKSLVSPVLAAGSLNMDENNVVEIWIIGT